MTAKEYLSEVQRLQTIIGHKREKIKEYRHVITSVSLARINLAKVQASSPAGWIGGMVGKLVDLESEVERDMLDIACKQHETISMIHKLDNVLYIQVLFKKYIQGKGMDAIAKDMGEAIYYVLQLHGQAIEAFETANKGVLGKGGIISSGGAG